MCFSFRSSQALAFAKCRALEHIAKVTRNLIQLRMRSSFISWHVGSMPSLHYQLNGPMG
jgi:hypothetical protein